MAKRLSKDEQKALQSAILKYLKREGDTTVRWLTWGLNQDRQEEATETQVRTQLQKLADEDKVQERGLSNRRRWSYVTAEQRRERSKARKDRKRVEVLAQLFHDAGFDVDPESYHGESIAFNRDDLEKIAKRFRLVK